MLFYQFSLLLLLEEQVNTDIENIITPVNVGKLKELLLESNYLESETDYLTQGFAKGFDLEYDGPTQRKTMHGIYPSQLETVLYSGEKS